MIEKLIDKLQDLQINIELLEHQNLKIHADISKVPDEVLTELHLRKEELVKYLKEQEHLSSDDFESIPAIELRDHYELSSAQKRLWTLSHLDAGNTAYNIPGVYVFEGDLDRGSLAYSFEKVIERHEILRTVFREDEHGSVRQFILPPGKTGFSISYVDLKREKEQKTLLDSMVREEMRKPFRLDAGPLVRASLFEVDDDKWVFTYTLHHIISDAWSMRILITELLLLYHAHARGGANPLAPLRIQYKDYASWQRDRSGEDALAGHKAYWLRQFEGELPVLDLRGDRPRPAVKTTNGGIIQTSFDKELLRGLKAFCTKQEGTLFMGLMALVNTLLYRYTSQEDIILGAAVAGREHKDLENQIGIYINTLALRSKFRGSDSYRELFGIVKQVTLDAYDHQDYPFEELVNALDLQYNAGRDSLFDVMIELQDHRLERNGSSDGLGNMKARIYDGGTYVVSKFDLTFFFVEKNAVLNLLIEYNRDIFNKESIERIGTHLERLLREILLNPEIPVNRLSYIDTEERDKLLYEWNDTKMIFPEAQNVISLFEKQASQAPDNTALVFAGRVLSYKELDEKANQLANYLRETYGIRPGDLVGIMLDRSGNMIISILGVLKSGCAYVPVDPDYPAARKEFIVKDTGIKVLITQQDHMFGLEYYEGGIFAADIQLDNIDTSPVAIAIPTRPDDLAYVIYTSGSTGTPKGCAVTCGNLYNYIQWANSYYFKLTGRANFGLFTSLSFDLTITSIFCSLTNGGQLYIYRQQDDLAEILLHSFSAESDIDSIKLTPAHINTLEYANIKSTTMSCAIVGGEEVTDRHIRILKRINPAIEIFNEYGPTETTVGCVVTQLEEGVPVLIGKPVFNTIIYILDEGGSLCPTGVPGEIHISGDGVARGYLNREELTKEKFVTNPFSKGGRMYRTGDLGRWLTDGNLEFIGRKDEQVKIKGYRIELGEIESVLQKHSAIKEAVVLARKDQEGNNSLVAYYVPDKGVEGPDIGIAGDTEKEAPAGAKLCRLSDDVSIYGYNKAEVQFSYEDIFRDHCYLKYGMVFPAGGCIMDIGANIGMFSVFAGMQNEGLKIYSFEPLPQAFELLKLNTSLYRGDFKVFNHGISDKEETGSKTISQIIEENRIERIDYLRIDMENSGVHVLDGIMDKDWDKIGQMVLGIRDIDSRKSAMTADLSGRGFMVYVNQRPSLENTDLYDVFAVSAQFIAASLPANDSASSPDNDGSGIRGKNRYTAGELEKDLEEFLGKQLPAYMVPRRFVPLDGIPLTINGKVDKKALLRLEGPGAETEAVYIAPRNAKEQHLAAVCEEVLKIQSVSITDDLFVLGCDSIKAIQIVSRLKQRGYTLTVQDVLLFSVVEQLAERITIDSRSIEQELIEGFIPLSPIQAFFFQGSLKDKHHMNQSVLLYSKKALSEEGIQAALDKIMLHHDALRMVFWQGFESWIQENKGKEQTCPLEVIEVADDKTYTAHCERIQSTIDLEKGPLFKAVLFRLPEEDRLLLVAHHLVIDGVSWRILFDDLSDLYQQYLSGEPLSLPLKTNSFKYWQEQQLEYSQSDTLLKESRYWSAIESIPIESLPLDDPRGSNLLKDAVSYSFWLDERTTKLLLTECYKSYHTEINDIMLTALSLALKETFNINKVLIRLEGHGREDIGTGIDVTRTVGWFSTLYPVVFDMRYSDDIVRQLIEVKESLHRVPNKGIGYGILRYMTGMDYTFNPEITFNYLGDFGSGIETKQGDRLFEFSPDYHGREIPGDMQRDCVLSASGMVIEGKMRLSIDFGTKQYVSSTIERLQASYKNQLTRLIERLATEEKPHLTPVDLTYKGLGVDELAALNKDDNVEDVYSLSPLQEGLYYHWVHSPGFHFYFEQMSYQLKGGLDIGKIEKSYQMLISRHAILRTCFVQDLGETLLQIVKKEVPPTFAYLDVSGDTRFSIEDHKAADRSKGFDLHKGSQMRLTVLRLEDDTYEFIWSHHHILMDGWCVGILIKEFFLIYYSLLQDKPPALNKVYSYAGYINWLDKIDKVNSLQYWRNYLAEYDTITGIPKLSGTAGRDKTIRRRVFSVEGPVRHAIRTLCGELAITENTFIQTIWGILLGKLNNAEDVVFGSVVSGRPGELEGIEEMIGSFINTIPVRIPARNGITVRELLKSVQQASITGSAHHYIQLADIQSQSELGSNLFDNILMFENYPVREMVEQSVENKVNMKALSLQAIDIFEQTNYDFTLTVTASGAITVKFNYNAGSYPETQIDGLQERFIRIIEKSLERPDAAVNQIDCLNEKERRQQLVDFNDTWSDYARGKTLVDLFGEQVAKAGDALALIFDGVGLTYRELNERSNQLADFIVKKYDVRAGDLVGLQLERSDWMIVSILAVLKSGGAYVPLDPDHPQERIAYILADSKARLVIDAAVLDEYKADREQYTRDNPSYNISPGNLAYVIYTSGTTGKPKGVMVGHASVVSFFENIKKTFDFTSDLIMGATTHYTFDISILELLGTLLNGIPLHLVKNTDTVNLFEFIQQHDISALQITPSRLNQLLELDGGSLDGLKKLKLLLIGGEALSVTNYNRLKELNSTRVINVYGPTETTIWSTCLDLHKSDGLSIGAPLLNEMIYILDRDCALLPPGAIGEICIGGEGLAQGYLNEPALTAEKFVPNPFAEGQRIYRTGDLGRWLPDGKIEFISRKDDQVKIRGHRIEMGEIESALLRLDLISEAAVMAKEDGSGNKNLVAYVAAGKELNVSDLRSELRHYLPDYMLPAYFVQLDRIPLMPSGKVNKKALPAPLGLDISTGVSHAEPENVIEERLLAIWKEVLGQPVISVTDNFFALGGNSINLIRLNIKINKAFGRNEQLGTMFNFPTIRSMAEYLEACLPEAEALSAGKNNEYDLLPDASYNQLIYFSGWKPENDPVIISYAFGNLQVEAFKLAVRQLVGRHEILRTVFVRAGETIKQRILSPEESGIKIEDPVSIGSVSEMHPVMEKARSGKIDLYAPPLFHVQLYKLPEDRYTVLLTMHHIITDGYSTGILQDELTRLYEENLKSEAREPDQAPMPGGVLPIQYRDFVQWQRAYLDSPAGAAHKEYWLTKLKGFVPDIHFPLRDDPAMNNKGNVHGLRITSIVDGKLYRDIDQFVKDNCLTHAVLMMGVLTLILNRLTGQDDITITAAVSARNSAYFGELDISGLIGLFSNSLFVRNIIDREIPLIDYFHAVQDGFISDLDAGIYPFKKLMDELPGIAPDMRFFEPVVFYNYHNYDYFKEVIYDAEEPEREGIVEEIPPTGSHFGLTVTEFKNSLKLEFLFSHVLSDQKAAINELYFSILKQAISTPRVIIGQMNANK